MSPRTADGLFYELTGSGPALLMIHEGIGDRTMWASQWARWRDRFSLLRYDQRGFGDSDDPSHGFRADADALAVLDEAGIDRAAVIGASMGGKAALDLTVTEPGRVWALVAVVATPSGWTHSADHLARFDAIEKAYERGGIPAANELELEMWVDGVGRPAAAIDPSVREAVGRMNLAALEREEARERAGIELEPAVLDPHAIGRLAEVRAPTLVVTGALDQPSVNAGAAAMAAGIAGAERVELADTAHVPFIERPREFDEVVLPFLARHAPGSRA